MVHSIYKEREKPPQYLLLLLVRYTLSICGSPDTDPTPEKKSTPTPTPDSGVRFSGVRESRMVPKSYKLGGMCLNKHICTSS
jgi:hypothetical protein